MEGDSSQPTTKLQPKHPQAEAVLKIIHEAQAKAQSKDYKKAIQLLDKAKKLLPQLDQSKSSGGNQTMENKTVQNTSDELTYSSKLANIYYNIHQYDKSFQIYQKLTQKIPGNPKLQKALGDSLRHLGRYDEAIQIYEQGVKICTVIKSYAQFGASILNSEGLTYAAQEKYDEAINKFEAAINITPKNALYLCNAGAAYQSKGNREKALQSYEGAQKLLKTPLDDVGLSKENVKFIEKSLSKFLQNLKKLQSIQTDDDAFNNRVNNYGTLLNKSLDQGINNPKDGQRSNPETQAKNLYDAQKILKMLDDQANVNLKRFYKGMLGTLTSSYTNAEVVQKGTVQLNTSNLAASVASNLAAFLPVIGSQLSSAINFASNFITANEINKQACNILNLATDNKQFETIAQDVTLKIIYNNKDYLLTCNPEQYILPAWAHSFEAAAKWLKEKKEAFEGHLFGSRFQTEHSRYGFKLATDVLAKHVATGKIYKGDIPEDIPLEEMKKRLCSASEEVFKADRDVQKDRAKLAKEGKLPEQQKQSRKCQIY